MKRLLSILIFVSSPCLAVTNQLEFDWGRGSPLSSIQAGGSSDQIGARGSQWSADWLHLVGHRAYLGIGGGHFSSGDNTSGTFVPNATSILSSKMTSILVLSRVDLTPPSRLVPYVITGIGWVKNSLTVTSGNRILLDDSHNTAGYVAGLGIDLSLTDALFIGAEARYQSSFQRTFTLTPEGQAVTGQNSVQTPAKIFNASLKAGIRY